VIIRNLVIRDSAQKGIQAFKDFSDGWVIENNEFVNNGIGLHHGNTTQVRRNLFHDNWQYAIESYQSSGSVIEDNDFSFNAARASEFPGDAGASKWLGTTNMTVRNNDFHDNFWSAIWFDYANMNVLIENNRVVNNRGSGVFYEANGQGIIRNNVVSGNAREDVYLSESHDVEVYGNTIATLRRGVSLFQDGARVPTWELGNDYIHDNSVTVLPVSGALAVSLSCLNLTATQCSAYSTSRGIRFEGNDYDVPATAGSDWYAAGALRNWPGWQAFGFDMTGSVS
jgi:parallel beta-helix repeat protein